MRTWQGVLAGLLCVLVVGCSQPANPQRDEKKADNSAEDTVADFLATRELLRSAFRDTTSPEERTSLKPHVIDWLALGVHEPLDQRLALAQVLNMEPQLLKDNKYFDGGYKEFVRASLGVGVVGPKAATDLLQEKGERGDTYAKNCLAASNQDLTSETNRNLILELATSTTDKDFSTELACYAARTLAFMKDITPPDLTTTHTAAKQAFREALNKHPDLAEPLKRNIELSDEVRPSHERLGKLIRGMSGG